jgi:hypothetical protein
MLFTTGQQPIYGGTLILELAMSVVVRIDNENGNREQR